MTKQLGKAPPTAILHVHWDQKKLKSQARVAELNSPLCLTRDVHGEPIPADALPRSFSIEWTQDLQKGKGRSTVGVLDGIMTDLETFYGLVVEGVVAFVPRAPKLPVVEAQEAPAEVLGLVAIASAPRAEPPAEMPGLGGAELEPEAPAESGEILANVTPLMALSARTSQPPPSCPPTAGRVANG